MASDSREREIFQACLGLPLTQRESYLSESCGADAGLQERVRRP